MEYANESFTAAARRHFYVYSGTHCTLRKMKMRTRVIIFVQPHVIKPTKPHRGGHHVDFNRN